AGRKDPAGRTARAAGAVRRTGPAGCSSSSGFPSRYLRVVDILAQEETLQTGGGRTVTKESRFGTGPRHPGTHAPDPEHPGAGISPPPRTADRRRAGRRSGAAVRAL